MLAVQDAHKETLGNMFHPRYWWLLFHLVVEKFNDEKGIRMGNVLASCLVLDNSEHVKFIDILSSLSAGSLIRSSEPISISVYRHLPFAVQRKAATSRAAFTTMRSKEMIEKRFTVFFHLVPDWFVP